MAGFDNSVLTDVGRDALVEAEAGKHIEYVTFEAGDGEVFGGDAEMIAMTSLKHFVMDFPITNFSNDGDGQLTLIGVISSANVTTGFHLREIGVKCTIDGGPEILYAVSNSGTDADYIPGATEGTVIQTIQFIIKIDRASNVTVIIQPGLDVTCQNIGPGTAGAGWFRDKISQICWFKRVKSPKGTIDIKETSDLITIDTQTIDENLDMWVAIGNPDIFPNFSTIQKALNYLSPKFIRPGILVTITVMSGKWPAQPMTKVDHPNSPQIRIMGTAGAVRNVTGATGSEHAVTLNGTNVGSELAVGDYFLYNNTTNDIGHCISGCWKVASRSTNSVTFDAAYWGSFPSLGPVSGGTVTPIKSVYPIQAGQSGIQFHGLGLGLLKHLVLINTGDPGGGEGFKAVAGITNLEKCGVHAWGSGIGGSGFDAQLAGRLNCLDCAASSGHTGFQAGWGGVLECTNCFGTSNSYAGFRAEGGYIRIFTGGACGNNTYGFVAGANGTGLINALIGAYNDGDGLRSSYNSFVSSAGGDNIFEGNGDDDISLAVCSQVTAPSGPGISYGNSNIASNSLSNDGCWFQPT